MQPVFGVPTLHHQNGIDSRFTCTDFLKELNMYVVPNFLGELQISCECGLANIRLSLCVIPDRLDDVYRGRAVWLIDLL